MFHGSSMTWFQTSRYCQAKVEFNSINLVWHGSSTTFETRLTLEYQQVMFILLPAVHNNIMVLVAPFEQHFITAAPSTRPIPVRRNLTLVTIYILRLHGLKNAAL